MKWEVSRSGELKGIGIDALTQEQRDYLQSLVDNAGATFRSNLLEYRTGIDRLICKVNGSTASMPPSEVLSPRTSTISKPRSRKREVIARALGLIRSRSCRIAKSAQPWANCKVAAALRPDTRHGAIRG